MNAYANDFSTTVQVYSREIKKYKPIPVEIEKELFKKIKKGNEIARKRLMESHLRYVLTVAKEYRGKGVPMEDLISEGNIGLNKALDRFDEKKDVKFITYAVWWIRQSIQDCLKKRLKIKLNEVYEEDYFMNNDTSYTENKILGESYHTTTEYDDVMDELNESKKKVIGKLLKKLPKRGQEIIKHYYGLEEYEEKTLEEIGKELSLTKERVRQIKEKSLQVLRSEIMLDENFDDLFV